MTKTTATLATTLSNGELLLKLRAERGLSHRKLAELTGVTKSTLSRLELGQSPGTEETWNKIAAFFRAMDSIVSLGVSEMAAPVVTEVPDVTIESLPVPSLELPAIIPEVSSGVASTLVENLPELTSDERAAMDSFGANFVKELLSNPVAVTTSASTAVTHSVESSTVFPVTPDLVLVTQEAETPAPAPAIVAPTTPMPDLLAYFVARLKTLLSKPTVSSMVISGKTVSLGDRPTQILGVVSEMHIEGCLDRSFFGPRTEENPVVHHAPRGRPNAAMEARRALSLWVCENQRWFNHEIHSLLRSEVGLVASMAKVLSKPDCKVFSSESYSEEFREFFLQEKPEDALWLY